MVLFIAGGETWTRAGKVAPLIEFRQSENFCRSVARHAGASKRCSERQDSTEPAN